MGYLLISGNKSNLPLRLHAIIFFSRSTRDWIRFCLNFLFKYLHLRFYYYLNDEKLFQNFTFFHCLLQFASAIDRSICHLRSSGSVLQKYIKYRYSVSTKAAINNLLHLSYPLPCNDKSHLRCKLHFKYWSRHKIIKNNEEAEVKALFYSY